METGFPAVPDPGELAWVAIMGVLSTEPMLELWPSSFVLREYLAPLLCLYLKNNGGACEANYELSEDHLIARVIKGMHVKEGMITVVSLYKGQTF